MTEKNDLPINNSTSFKERIVGGRKAQAKESIFYTRLMEAQTRPDKEVFMYVIPLNIWYKIESITYLDPTAVSFVYEGFVDGIKYLLEETIRIDSIRSFKFGTPIPEDADTILENTYNKDATSD